MILVDTNIIIDCWNTRHPPLSVVRTLYGGDAAICGVVRAELLHGSHSEAEHNRIERNLQGFAAVPFTENDWNGLGYLLFILKSHGLAVP